MPVVQDPPFARMIESVLKRGREIPGALDDASDEDESLLDANDTKLEAENRVTRKILRESGWYGIRDSLSQLKMDLKSLTKGEVAQYGLSSTLADCHGHMLAYIAGIEGKIMRAKAVLENLSFVRKKAVTDSKFADAVNKFGTSYTTHLSTRDASLPKLINDLQNNTVAQNAFQSTITTLKEAEGPINTEANDLVTQAKELLQTQNANIQALEKRLEEIVCENYDAIERIKMRLKTNVDTFYHKVANVVNASKIYKSDLDGVGDRKTVIGALLEVGKRAVVEQEKAKMYRRALFWVFFMSLFLGGATCLIYYAYEAHIKPLYLGVSIALVGVAFLGLTLLQFFQMRAVKRLRQQAVAIAPPSRAVRQPENQALQVGGTSYNLGNA